MLVRHGTTEWVDKHILHGITDIPLNEKGLRQAREAASALESVKASYIYTSPLKRCLQTAEIISERTGTKPHPLDDLKELDFGWLEGRTFRDHSSQDFGPLIRVYDHFAHLVIREITGESQKKFIHRVLSIWQQVLDENPNGTVIIVGHSAVFNMILIHLFGKNFPKDYTYYVMKPGSINEILIQDDGSPELARLNDISHLTKK